MRPGRGHSNCYMLGEKAETVSNYAASQATVSPITVDGVDREPSEQQLEVLSSAIKVHP